MAKTRGVSFEKMEQAIMAAAGELFDEKGFNQTSLQDIADALGMSRPSLYHYFDNREQILATGIEPITQQRDALTQELRDAGGDPIERLTKLMLGLGTLVAEHPVWVRVLLRDAAALPDDSRERDRRSRLAYLDLLITALRDGMDAGVVRPLDEQVTALIIIASLFSLQGQYAAATTDTRPDEITQLTVDIILHGLLTDDPRQGTPIERGLDLIREGMELVKRGNRDVARRAG
ncbi:MAG TPA: TetR/AcrR family transcriptional regulator [Acidimicrobiales bacterium]|nr:TetR/AcrR family transcriptional regulator [Acidimicrobiales bacterium]